MSHTLRSSIRIIAALSAVFILAAAAPAARFHTKLLKSEPATKDTLVAAPKAIKLWFNEKVDLKLTTVKLEGPAGAITLGALSRDGQGKDAPVVASIPTAVGAGNYTVNWSVAGDDGHPVKGNFGFVVKSAK
jgi:methionine-rich copper-binding protein CopC